MIQSDLVVIGAGLVGLSSAYSYLKKFPASRVLVLEKERDICLHQSGRNSGVLHTGVYYRPDSLKAKNCLQGRSLLSSFCAEHNIPINQCGKIIVAVTADELPGLNTLHQRAIANGVICTKISPEQILEIEPHVRGLEALHIPEAGVIDFKLVGRTLKAEVERMGGEIICGVSVSELRNNGENVRIETSSDIYLSKKFLNCAGLYADLLCKASGGAIDAQIIPFRGEYYCLKDEYAYLCKGLIYPVPNPDFPFLGVHLTRSVEGTVECGPNAVLALAREGYDWGTVNLVELYSSLTYPGMLRLMKRHWREGLHEICRSVLKQRFVKAIQRLVPEVQPHYLEAAPAGVRAQALSREGKTLDDFVFVKSKGGMHVINAPSPAATSCLSIGEELTRQLV